MSGEIGHSSNCEELETFLKHGGDPNQSDEEGVTQDCII